MNFLFATNGEAHWDFAARSRAKFPCAAYCYAAFSSFTFQPGKTKTAG